MDISDYTDIYQPLKQKIEFCESDKDCPSERKCIDFWNFQHENQQFKKVCQTYPVYGQIAYVSNILKLMNEAKIQCQEQGISVEKCLNYQKFQREFNDLRGVQQQEPNFTLFEVLSQGNEDLRDCSQSQILVSGYIKKIFTPSEMIKQIQIQKQIQNRRVLDQQQQLQVDGENQQNNNNIQPQVENENENQQQNDNNNNQKKREKGDIKVYFLAISIIIVIFLVFLCYKGIQRYLKNRPGDLEALKDNKILIKKQEIQNLSLEKNINLQSNNQMEKQMQPIAQNTQFGQQNQESDIRQQLQNINLDSVSKEEGNGKHLETSVDKKFFVIDNDDDEENNNNIQDKIYDNIDSNRNEDNLDQDSSIQYSNVFNLEGEGNKQKSSSRKRRFKNTFGSKQNLNLQNVNQSTNNNNSVMEFNTQT